MDSIIVSSSSSGGEGLVDMEDSGDEGGAVGMGRGLVGTDSELVDRSDMDGMTNDEVWEESADVSFDGVAGRNLPLLSRCMSFAIVAIARFGTRWDIEPI
jgi:hypothetical protein